MQARHKNAVTGKLRKKTDHSVIVNNEHKTVYEYSTTNISTDYSKC